MAYIKPAVQVYQDLVNAGGAQQLSPDMPACIVGTAKTVIDVDLDSVASKSQSIGSTDNGTSTVPAVQTDATFDSVADGEDVYINVTSRKPGQANTVLGNIFVENAVVENVTATSSITTPGTDIVIDLTNVTVGGSSGEPIALTDPLPYFSSLNHVSIGDTVVEFSGSIPNRTVTATSYITAIDVANGTVSVADTTGFTTTGTISIFHKFAQLPLTKVTGQSGDVVLDASGHASPYNDGASGVQYPIESEIAVENVAGASPLVGDPFSIYVAYEADRGDLVGTVLTINDIVDLGTKLGPITPSNELAFGVSLALANSGGTAVNAITLDPSLSLTAAHTAATELAQAQRLYAMVPLTQELSIQAIYKAHVNAMSLPESGNWRAAMVNCEVPEYVEILGRAGTGDGPDDDEIPDGLIPGTYNSTNTTMTLDRPFATAGVRAGDRLYSVIVVTDPDTLEVSYEYIWSEITAITPNTIIASASWEDSTGTAVTAPVSGSMNVYVARFATKQQQAQWVADQSATWIDKRVWNFPGDVYVLDDSGLEIQVPGYFLQCALSGFISGSPAQQPITNIAIAGITDLVHGNFYFTEAQMNLMAQFGTMLYAQNNQGTTPFCRHGLTTDVSVLEYREILKVKNWDYLSYYYKDILAPFIGTWNITPDTLQTIRQTVISASESLLIRKLPKIGAPLLSYNIDTLAQSTTSTDAIDLYLNIAIVSPTNYINTHLVI